jgi:hypothetical protein
MDHIKFIASQAKTINAFKNYLQSLVELYMLNAYAMWDSSSEATDLHMKVKNMNLS